MGISSISSMLDEVEYARDVDRVSSEFRQESKKDAKMRMNREGSLEES